MKILAKSVLYAIMIIAIIFFNALFFIHHPPEVQLLFITPGFIILGYSILSDDFRKKSPVRSRWSRGR